MYARKCIPCLEYRYNHKLECIQQNFVALHFIFFITLIVTLEQLDF
jgi:hypothetical protein